VCFMNKVLFAFVNCFELDIELRILHCIMMTFNNFARVIGVVFCASHLNIVVYFALSVFDEF